MSDTPRTDAKVRELIQRGLDFTHPANVMSSFAGQLERENAKAAAEIENLSGQNEPLRSLISQLKERLSSAERQRDEARCERDALLKLITGHNAELANICAVSSCEEFRGRGRNCPNCPRAWAIELPEFAIFLHEDARRLLTQEKTDEGH